MKLSELKNYKVVQTTAPSTPPPAPVDNRDFIQKGAEFAEKYIPGAQIGKALGNSIGGIVDSVKQGSVEPLLQAGDRNNANFSRVAGDVVQSVATPASLAVSAPATLAGRVAQGVGLGATLSGSNAAAKGGDMSDVTKSAALGGAVGGALPIAGAGIRQLGKLLGRTGDKIQFSVIKPTQADIKDGFNINTVKKFNLGGSLKQSFEKTDKTLDDLSKQLNAKLASSNASLDLNKVYENTAKRVLGNKFEQFGANSSVEKTLEQLRNEISSVSGANGIVSVPEAQTVKRAAGHFGAWTFGSPSVEATAQQKVYNAFYNEMKTAIEKASPEGVREINKQMSELIPVMNALIRRIPVAERNSALSLTDVITMSAATLEPRALALTVANLASKSGRVGAVLSKAGERIANPPNAALGNALRTGATSLLGSTQPEQQTEPQSQSEISQDNGNTLSDEQKAALMRGVEIGKMVDPTGALGTTKAVLSRIHPQDIKLMYNFIDYARVGKEFTESQFAQIEKLAEHFGISMDKGLRGVANALEDVLDGKRKVPNTLLQGRDDIGRFTGSK